MQSSPAAQVWSSSRHHKHLNHGYFHKTYNQVLQPSTEDIQLLRFIIARVQFDGRNAEMLVVGGRYREFHQQSEQCQSSLLRYDSCIRNFIANLSPRKKSSTFTVRANDVATVFRAFNRRVILGSLVVTYSTSTSTWKYFSRSYYNTRWIRTKRFWPLDPECGRQSGMIHSFSTLFNSTPPSRNETPMSPPFEHIEEICYKVIHLSVRTTHDCMFPS